MSAQASFYNGPSTILRPRPDVMRAFINYWFEGCNGSIEIAWRNPYDKKLNQTAHFDWRDPALERFACDINSIPGQDCYFTASIVKNTEGRAADKDVVCSPGFWVDQDELEHINYANSIEHEFRPTSYVFTGRTPDPRRQMWFKLDEPTYDPNLVREINAKLVSLYKGDRTVVNPSRLMRLPGGISWPWKPGRTPELVSWEHPTDGRRRSHPLTLTAALPDIAQPPLVEGVRTSNVPSVSELTAAIKANDHWHNNMTRLVAQWVGMRRSDAEILDWADQFTLEGYDVDQTLDEMQVAIDSARNKWSVPNEDRPAITFENGCAIFAAAPPLPTQPVNSIEDWTPIGKRAADIAPDKRPHLCRGVIKTGMTGVLHAPHFTGKTILMADLACSIAHGVPWMGHNCKQGNVYVAELEGECLLADNIRAWHLRRNLPVSDNIIIASEFFQLFETESLRRLESDLMYFHQKLEGGISFIALDTYSQAIAGQDENSTAIGAAAAKILRRLSSKIGATGLTIHHSNAAGDLRGAKSFIANQDFEIALINGERGDAIQIKYKKLKGSKVAESDYFKISRVDLPDCFDDDGEQINAGVTVQISDHIAKAEVNMTNLKPRSAREVAFSVIKANATDGRVHEDNALSMFNLDYSGVRPKASGKSDTNLKTQVKSRKAIFQRAVRELEKDGLVKREGKWIRIVQHDPAKIFTPIGPNSSLAQGEAHQTANPF